MIKKILFIFIFFAGFFWLDSKSVFAAQFYFTKPANVEAENPFSIRLMFHADSFVNAVEGDVFFDASILKFESWSDSGSVINIWIEKPQVASNGRIHFSGIAPGGFGPVISRENEILEFKFKPLQVGLTKIKLENYSVYLHQSIPEKEPSSADELTLTVVPHVSERGQEIILDFYPPEPFDILLAKSPFLFDGKIAAVFSATDKESGIDYYEIRERFLGFSGEWRRAESPYQLLHQSLFSIIEVRAFDKVGHVTTEKFIPINIVYLFIGAFCLLLVFVLFLIVKLGYELFRKKIARA